MRMLIKSVKGDLRIFFRNVFLKHNSISNSILSLLFTQSIDKKHLIMMINKPYIPLILNRLVKKGLVSHKDNYYYLTKMGIYLALSIKLDLSLLQLSIISIVYHYYDTAKKRYNSTFPAAVSDITKILTLLNTSRNERYVRQQLSKLVKRGI